VTGHPIPIGTVPTVLAVRQLLEAASAARRCGDRGAAEMLETDAVLALRAGTVAARQAAPA
jgi:hypothetical protein